MKLHVLMPVYNDWRSAEQLLRDLDAMAEAHGLRLSATLVDDGSTEALAWPPGFREALPRFGEIEILHLQGNRGQPMAVTLGLAQVLRRQQAEPVLLMDADGQDRAADIPALIAAFQENPSRLVMAERRHRPEGLRFRLCYGGFQMLFRTLIGRPFRIGIFGLYPVGQIEALLRIPSLQRSIAGTIIASGLAERFVETDRGERYFGQSRFGFRGHIRHALGILAANRKRLVSRLARASAIASAIFLAATALYAALAGTWALDLWTTLGLVLAALFGALSFGLAMSLRFRRAETAPTTKALWAAHVARVGIVPAAAATPE